MKNNLNIAVDYDGCAARTSDFICELVNLMTCRNYTYKDIKSWDFWEKEGWNKQFWKAYDFMDRNGRLSIKPYDNHLFSSLSQLNLITKKPFDIVTANDNCAAPHIYKWMAYYNGYGTNEAYSYPNFTVKCIGRKTAAEKLALDYQIYIDDNPNLAEAASKFPNKQILLANAPWNKHIKNSINIQRFESWKEVPELVKNMKNKTEEQEEDEIIEGEDDLNEMDLATCEQCGENARDGYICHNCGLKKI